MQGTTGVAHGSSDVFVVIGFCHSAERLSNVLLIVSKTTGELSFHPGAGFFDESVTLSLRANGTTTTYSGTTVASMGNYNDVAITIFDAELIDKLRSTGQWDVLIEGKNWYIRTKINGDLPQDIE